MQLVLEHVDYTYQAGSVHQATALQDVSLSIGQGELVTVIGHGGSGKSTLALLLAGLYQPGQGRRLMQADDLAEDQLRRQIGIAFQYPEHQLFGETVFEEVAFGARNLGVPEDYLAIQVSQALERVGLAAEQFLQRSPFQLSGGQKRRVCLASVLVTGPSFLILDEPSSGLDERGRQWLTQLVRDLHEKGKTIIWITHDMEEAAEIANRIIVLNQGRIALDGTPEQVFAAEQVLQAANLELPPAAKLVRRLRQRGANLPGLAVTNAAACAEIIAWKAGCAVVPEPAAGAESTPPAEDKFDLSDLAELESPVREWKGSDDGV